MYSAVQYRRWKLSTKMIFLLLLCYVVIARAVSSSDIDCFFVSRPRQQMVTGDSVYGLEGASVVISCFINNYNTEDRVCTLALTVVDASGIRKRSYVNTGSYVFSIASLEKQHAGNYTVTCLKGKRTIQLHVLYPPEKAEMQGPYTIEKGSPLNLTCETDANPPGRYWWKYDLSKDSPIIATGSTITIPALQHGDTWLYCFAQNTMKPTIGSAVTKPPIHIGRHLVIKQDPAHIRDLPKEFTTYSGLTISIYCDVGGVPTPTVWWTKQDDESFMKIGNRLTADNVKNDISGLYHCNAKNTMMENGTDHTVLVSRGVYLTVNEPPGIYHVWSVVAAVVTSVVVAGCVSVVVLHYIRKRKMSANRRADNESAVRPMRLSTVMSSDEPVPDQSGHASNQPTENSCNPASQELHINHHNSSEETRRKSIDDTQVLYDLL